MTSTTPSLVARSAVGAAVAAASLIAFVTQAGAVNARVQSACANDYLSYCSQHDPDGPGARRCMRANGLKLSKSCVDALVAAGEVSKAEVARRSAGK